MFFSVCRVGAAGPPGMDLPECVEDSMQWGAFKKSISPGRFSGFLRYSHCYRQSSAEMVLIGQIVPE
jgi:hypothetical protein